MKIFNTHFLVATTLIIISTSGLMAQPLSGLKTIGPSGNYSSLSNAFTAIISNGSTDIPSFAYNTNDIYGKNRASYPSEDVGADSGELLNAPGGIMISGVIDYNNAILTHLGQVKVYLINSNNVIIDSTITLSGSGAYSFSNVSAGTYTLSAITLLPWGGVNASDALQAAQTGVGLINLSELRTKAADVNNSNSINGIDALLILRRFAGLSSTFQISDWQFESNPAFTVTTNNITLNFKAICAGDLNGSYIPPVNGFQNCGDTLTDIRNAEKYPTVQIGTQCWMKKSMNIGTIVTSINTGFSHSELTNNGIIEKYCYNNDPVNCAIYGGLYDWNEMMGYTTTPGVQGICPTGWHIPTDAEWCTMTTYLDATMNCANYNYSGTTIGGKLKETGYTHWASPNTGATNESGFTALGAGYRGVSGHFFSLTRFPDFWSSSESSSTDGVCWDLSYDRSDIVRYSYPKTGGFSVRCVKDTCILPPTQSNAGQDQTVIGSTTTLNANTALSGTGSWSILSGTGGMVSQPTNSGSNFTGSAGVTYMLTWMISTACASSIDTLVVILNLPLGSPCPGIPSFTYGGQQYNTVQIGTQCWMKENLNIGTMVISTNTGSLHSNCSNNGIVEKYCYNNDPAQCAVYGGLYDWNEMMLYNTTAGVQGICPSGWNIPTDAEWCTMTTYLDATVNCTNYGFSGTNVGGKLKETGLTHWYSPNTGAANENGFTALGAGNRDGTGGFNGLTSFAGFWSSSEGSSANGINRYLGYSNSDISRYGTSEANGFSVRCVKN